MRRSAEYPAKRALAAIIGLGAIVGGCSDIYYDRRETVLFGADNAVAANNAVQTVDPWPRGSANRNASTNGEVVAAAIERYRTAAILILIFRVVGGASEAILVRQVESGNGLRIELEVGS